eukprot:scaffold5756_cov123-Isochrysis_galbana.AAC.2
MLRASGPYSLLRHRFAHRLSAAQRGAARTTNEAYRRDTPTPHAARMCGRGRLHPQHPRHCVRSRPARTHTAR